MLRAIMNALRIALVVATAPVWLPLYMLRHWLMPEPEPGPPTPSPEAVEAAGWAAAMSEAAAVREVARAMLAGSAPSLEACGRLLPETDAWLRRLAAECPVALRMLAGAPDHTVSRHLRGERLLDGVPAVMPEVIGVPSAAANRIQAVRARRAERDVGLTF